VERAARVRVNYLVNNTNLGPETTVELLAAGQAVVEEAAASLGIRVAFAGARRDLAPAVEKLLQPLPVLPLDLYMEVPWRSGK
jgi:hypothetical protein